MTIYCPYLLVCGKCSLDETGNTICLAEDKSWVCKEGLERMKRMKKKDGEQ